MGSLALITFRYHENSKIQALKSQESVQKSSKLSSIKQHSSTPLEDPFKQPNEGSEEMSSLVSNEEFYIRGTESANTLYVDSSKSSQNDILASLHKYGREEDKHEVTSSFLKIKELLGRQAEGEDFDRFVRLDDFNEFEV